MKTQIRITVRVFLTFLILFTAVAGRRAIVLADSGVLNIGMLEFADMNAEVRDSILKAITVEVKDKFGIDLKIDPMKVPIPSTAGCALPGPFDDVEKYDLVRIRESWIFLIKNKLGLADLPPNLTENLGLLAFSPEERPALAGGISTFVLFYNPDKLIGNLSQEPSWNNLTDLVQDNQLGIQLEPSYGVTLLESAAGKDFKPNLIAMPAETKKYFAPYADQIDKVQLSKTVYGAQIDALASDFQSGKTPLVLASTGFLTKLAQNGYGGSIAMAAFPRLNEQAELGESNAWVVPTASGNSELAWKVAQFLANDPLMIRWDLAQGALPGSTVAYDLLQKDNKMADGLLPNALLTDQGLKTMQQLVATATILHYPASLNADFYRTVFLPAGIKMMDATINGKVSLNKALDILGSLPDSLLTGSK